MSELSIFARFEIKYMVNREQRKMMEQAMKEHMTPDPHGKSTICNIYFDTPDYRLIRHSLEKPVYKEKMRIRSYGKVDSGQDVFLELKKKYKGIVYKRRVELPENLAMAYMKGQMSLEKSSWLMDSRDKQIAKELDYFKNFYDGLAPMVYLCYDRCAYFSTEDPNLRITFDKNIRWKNTDMSLTKEPGGISLLDDEYSLMEIKTSQGLPKWIVDVITKGKMRKASFSKYGKAYEMIQAIEKDNLFGLKTNEDFRKDVNNGNFISKHNDRNDYSPELYDKLNYRNNTWSNNGFSIRTQF